jgi:hypothetical protein
MSKDPLPTTVWRKMLGKGEGSFCNAQKQAIMESFCKMVMESFDSSWMERSCERSKGANTFIAALFNNLYCSKACNRSSSLGILHIIIRSIFSIVRVSWSNIRMLLPLIPEPCKRCNETTMMSKIIDSFLPRQAHLGVLMCYFLSFMTISATSIGGRAHAQFKRTSAG